MAKHPGGRPTDYRIEIDTEICDRLARGESLTSICRDKHMPSHVTVYAWLQRDIHAEFLKRYTRARERQAETFVDQCVDIADNNANDTITVEGKDGKNYERVNHEHINRSRLRVDTRIKIAEKLAPKKYTPKNEISGPEQGPVEIATPAEVLRRFAFMLRNKEEEIKENQALEDKKKNDQGG